MIRARRALTLALAVALMSGTALVALVAASLPARAADLTAFDPGNIISDAILFDGTDLTAQQVQDVLDDKGADCSSASTTAPCLKDYTEDTSSRDANERCDAYAGSAGESAASIIANVARTCGISARALIVMLQKEQGLVTASGSAVTERKYQIAMGYGCPDTAPCEAEYYGFYNQVYRAAYQLESYRLYPARYSHRAGITNNVRYHPNASCGTGEVFIANTATAALYNYTPYQPNAASLAAGYGTGDSCSSYGNRNFYAYFADWFGEAGYSVSGAVGRFYNSGGRASALGKAIGEEEAVAGGYWQPFENGDIYLNADGAWTVTGPLRTTYRSTLGPLGSLGWPSAQATCPDAYSCSQSFENGQIHTEWSAGTFAVIGAIDDYHTGKGGVTGPLGFPISASDNIAGARVQEFEGGSVYTSAAGTATLRGAMRTWYRTTANARTVGHPTGEETQVGSEVYQLFSNGSVHLSSSRAITVLGPISRTYQATNGASGALGAPLAVADCEPTSCVQEFAGGRIYTSRDAGTWAVSTAVANAIDANGFDLVGFPTGAESGQASVRTQTFQYAVAYTVDGRASILRGGLLSWHGGVSDRRGLGAATSNEQALDGGIRQTFTNGTAFVTPAGAFYAVMGAAATTYQLYGGPGSSLGWPTSSESCSGGTCVQTFEGGRIYRSGSEAFILRGAMLTTYLQGDNADRLGRPTGREITTSRGVYQPFADGTMFLTTTSVIRTLGPIDRAVWRNGSLDSDLGWPLSDASCPATTWCEQEFTRGSVYTANGSGTWAVYGAMDDYLRARGGVTAAGLGFPTGARTADSSGGFRQQFQRGALVQSSAGRVGPG